ncbi:uncharacterized protein TNCV_2723601 [Trichonephila clavipes]|nr:uncharacterized protein TNCV_2723601 [Trichonephila clavipes]
MACYEEDCGFQILNDDEIVTSVQEESNPVDEETDEDEDNNNNESSSGVAAVAEGYRYRIVACHVTSSSPVPLKTRPIGQRCTLNLSRAETSSHWCGVVVRRGVPAQVSSTSLDHGSKLRGPSPKALV